MTEEVDLQNRRDFPGMVGWFDPVVLAKTARKALNSALFGQYADRRLIHASLDPEKPAALAKRYDLRQFKPREDGAIWVDYVADLGDGFDSTYAIAYLLGQKSIKADGIESLPRAQLLLMGGDQVYPDASREDYWRRLRRPYSFAFPDSARPEAEHPPVFLIPGNHDWYDGLNLFLALFCRGRETPFGSWRASQHRSYFALQLPDNWWIWAYDSQLGEDIDQPQASYFLHVARAMRGSPKVILCAATPTWLKAELSAKDASEREKFERGLNYVAYNLLKSECPDARVLAVLSGDLHHYSRYSAEDAGTQFVTAGGGGAFLHPTHHLTDTISATWLREQQVLSLKTAPGVEHAPSEKPACYPDCEASRELALENWKFTSVNPQFCLALGVIYWIAAQLLVLALGEVFKNPESTGLSWAADIAASTVANPAFWIIGLALGGALFQYADAKNATTRLKLAAAHGLLHLSLLLLLVTFIPPVNVALAELLGLNPSWVRPGTIIHFSLFLSEMVIIGGFAAGAVWGLYLLTVSYLWGMHSNDAFSAMRLNSYRHFLRLRLKGDELTIYPIGLDRSPSREEWEVNHNREQDDQDKPVVIPVGRLEAKLIEGPVVVRAPAVQPIAAVPS